MLLGCEEYSSAARAKNPNPGLTGLLPNAGDTVVPALHQGKEGWPSHQENAGRVGEHTFRLVEPDVKISLIRLSFKQWTRPAWRNQRSQAQLM
jgi:hypothetical protein